jgi:protein-disulfide isomerase
VSAGGAIWSALVLMLSAWGMRKQNSDGASRAAGYVFLLSTVGLAAVFYFAYASFFVLRQACPLCLTMYVSVIGIFLLSAGAAGPLKALQSGFAKDLGGLTGSPTAAGLALVWLVASAGLVLAFPREQAVSAQAAAPAAPAVPLETLAPEQLTELHAWLDKQPTVAEAMPQGNVKVLLLKFNDYQCPSCRQAYLLYKDIIAKYEAAYPGVFKFENRDFPLETECGFGGIHGAACEAAVAVRLAKEKNLDKQLEATLFDRQSMSMTRDDVKAALREVTKISDSEFDSRYAQVLEAVKVDAQTGQRWGVSGTPTFFINGIKLGGFRPAAFDAVIAYELKKAGVTTS